jgi:replicative DNA helicase
MEEIVEDIGNNPQSENGLLTPYNTFNNMFGGLRPANLYAIASRPGQGKTTFLNDMAYKTTERNNIPTLILDTEMSTLEIQLRMVSNITDVPLWYIETGNWRKNEEMVVKVRAAWSKIKKQEYYHKHVANKNIDQICSLIRRWNLSKVGRGNQCLICYDYVKLTGEKMNQNWAEHQAIGQKIDKLKRISEEISAPVFTAMQLNRTGESFGRRGADVLDDSSAIALSDRLQWFASFVAIFRRKTQDEMASDGTAYGTHKLVPLKTRYQGRNASGHQDLVRRRNEDGSEGAWAINYLNFNVENFGVTDRGSLRDVINNTIPNDHEQGNEEPEAEEMLV